MQVLKKLLTTHWLLTLAIMFVTAALFGISSYNLFFLLVSNLSLVGEHGSQALSEGALEELAKLLCYGILSLLFYLLFKACEKTLVDHILK